VASGRAAPALPALPGGGGSRLSPLPVLPVRAQAALPALRAQHRGGLDSVPFLWAKHESEAWKWQIADGRWLMANGSQLPSHHRLSAIGHLPSAICRY
jgi:hypothetical protein